MNKTDLQEIIKCGEDSTNQFKANITNELSAAMDKNGSIWIKSGPDKRKATSREEIQRMFQESAYIESLDISGCIKDVFDDLIKFFSRNLKHIQKKQGVNSFAAKILPYRGLGNGVRRALKVYPDIQFIDDRKGNQFKVIISRQCI
jgi:hypothetical protein